MRMMEIRLRVSEDRVSTLYDLMRGYCECVSITPVEDKPRKRKFAHGMKNKGIRGDQLLVQLLTEGSKSHVELERAFEDRGFARSSVDPSISKMRHLVRNAGGQYYLIPQASLALVSP